MDTPKQPIDTAHEPVDLDDDDQITDTGVLHDDDEAEGE